MNFSNIPLSAWETFICIETTHMLTENHSNLLIQTSFLGNLSRQSLVQQYSFSYKLVLRTELNIFINSHNYTDFWKSN